MAHATPDFCSIKSEATKTIPRTTQSDQAETRAAYIASVLADWPPLTPQQQNTIGALLGNATPIVSVAEYQTLEIRRHLDAETPGKYGYFGNDEVSA